MRLACLSLSLLTLCITAKSQTDPPDGIYHVGDGVTQPNLIHKVEPEYSEQARSAMVQGTVVFEIVVDTNGKAKDIVVLSPLGFGLDERAQEAIEKWIFKPAEKKGKPVPVRARVEVNFRFPERWYDSKQEERRTAYNLALRNIDKSDAKLVQRAKESIQNLSKQKYPPAAFLHGVLLRTGEIAPTAGDDALKLIQFAADKGFGAALYEIGKLQLEGKELPLDPEKGLESLQSAAILGSPAAQLHLGSMYETGNGAAVDTGKARRYFRLCAAAGQASCQFRLARLMLNAPERTERDFVQSIAWLQLASESGAAPAKALLESEMASVTPKQEKWIAGLKAQLVRRQ